MEKENLEEEYIAEDESLSDLHTNSVYRTLKILESLSYNHGKTLEELAPIVNLARPTLYRFLTILTRMGYVSKNQDNRYRLTPKLFTVAAHSIDDVELSRIVKPFMEDLSFETGETTILGIRDDDAILHVLKVESRYTARFYERIGKHSPIYCTVMGLVILSGMSDDELNIYLQKERLIPYTINTITDPMELKKHIQKIREDGFAETISEYEQDIHSLGCPIFDHEGHIIASVSINWPLFREEPGKREKCLQGIKKVAAMASSLMGYKDTKLVETI